MLPVEAQAARRAPIMWAWVKAAVMPLSLKLPEGFMPSYCRYMLPGLQADVAADAIGLVQQRLPFADGDDLLGGGEGKQLAEPPHAAEAERVVAAAPFLFEGGKRLGNLRRVPVVDHVEQPAALVAAGAHFADVVRRGAAGLDAALVGQIGLGFDGRRQRVLLDTRRQARHRALRASGRRARLALLR